MKKMLITGGTVFVSRFAAQYFADKYDVYVLNRNTRQQCEGVTLIEGDRHKLTDQLKKYYFDVVLDITAYNEEDIRDLLDALNSFGDYILISSSAVYPETASQPFMEGTTVAPNKFWGKYGTDKIAAEKALLSRVPNAYILRPPYLYGPMNNVYREAFVFECAQQGRPFYLPGDGSMKLQFFHVKDLCNFIDMLLNEHPRKCIFNVGNPIAVSIKDWVTLCYGTVGKIPEFCCVNGETEQRNYFPFYNYEYYLDVKRQSALMPSTISMAEGLRESFEWYRENIEEVMRKPLLDFIDKHF